MIFKAFSTSIKSLSYAFILSLFSFTLKADQMPLNPLKNLVHYDKSVKKIEKRLNQKLKALTQNYTKNPVIKQTFQGLTVLTQSLLKKEFSFSKKDKYANFDLKIKEKEVSFQYSLSY